MKNLMAIIMVICFSCYALINMSLFAQSSDKLTYDSKWDKDMKWGLILRPLPISLHCLCVMRRDMFVPEVMEHAMCRAIWR